MDQPKKAVSHSEQNECVPSSCKTTMWSSKHGEPSLRLRIRTRKLQGGMMAWHVSARIWRLCEAPCPEAAMRCSENEPSRRRVLARTSGGGAKRPATGRCSNQPAQKGGRSRAEWWRGPALERCRYAAAIRTGIPILRALSTMLLVMPEPGKATSPFGRKLSRTSFRRKGAALPSRPQSGLQTTW